MSTMYTMSTDARPASQTLPLLIPLTAHHLRFTVRAVTPITFGEFKGSALRGALVGVLRRTFCPAGRQAANDPAHQALCPVCQLLSGEGDDAPEGYPQGDLRRPYAIEPPLDEQTAIAPGDRFCFGVALYGNSWGFFPYVALAAGGMGEFGVGRRGATSAGGVGERGKFVVEQIEAVNPLSETSALMMAPGERMVRTVTLPLTPEAVGAEGDAWLERLSAHENRLTVEFLTPTRITHQGEHTLKRPDFFPFCKQVVLRVLDLCTQFGGGRPSLGGEPLLLKRDLYPFADAVQLVADETRWWDLKGYSTRLERTQVLGGFVGRAIYHTADWRPLLPWLLWGLSTHVGKNIVKGCGLYRMVEPPAASSQPPAANS